MMVFLFLSVLALTFVFPLFARSMGVTASSCLVSVLTRKIHFLEQRCMTFQVPFHFKPDSIYSTSIG